MKLRSVLLSLCLITSLFSAAQSQPGKGKIKSTAQGKPFVDVMPEAPYDIAEYLSAHLHYPDSARAHNIEGKVKVKFMVDKQGKIDSCTVMQGIGWGCDEEALRVVRGMPAWSPGLSDGKPKNVYFALPITFKLEDDVKSK